MAQNLRMSEPEVPGAAIEQPVQVVLAEYAALRAEIAQRSTSQSQLVATAISLAGLGLAAGSVKVEWSGAALVVPVLCAVLGLMWGDHAVQIEKLGAYIEHVSGPHVRSLTSDPKLLAWEHVAKTDMTSSPRLLARLGVPVLAMGLVPSVPALALAIPHLDTLGEWVLLALGLVLEASFVQTWRKVLRPLEDSKYRDDLGADMRLSHETHSVT